MKRIATALLLSFGAWLVATPALAGTIAPYSAARFDRLTAAGDPVVLDIRASWCPTCAAQKPIIDRLMKAPPYQQVTLLTIDFDRDHVALRRFHVAMQSTLVAFKGRTEVDRSVGDTSAAGLEALFAKTVH
ncbi:MAG: hypothetical protein OJF60_000459 [Burkholderiaceae bacterium]|jgi:thiol-disulfide isomerase/thioredoxin|nr:MAG: hypothetical protein OJF60_000459 [Burkholderiaceae bacterium]